MRPLFNINDLHIGAVRSGGTTPATAMRLRQDLLFGFQQLLEMADDCDLIINGDLFDTANVPLTDMFSALQLMSAWLHKNPACDLILPPGNHDLSKNSEVFSSFDFFTRALSLEFPTRVFVPRMLAPVGVNRWVIPHMPNQDLFELELSKVPACDYLFLHCNYDSGFAAKSDHSLNLSKGQAESLVNRGVRMIILGHEHQYRAVRWADANGGSALMALGNQMPSSVADCLGNHLNGIKYALKIEAQDCTLIPTWYAADNFVEMQWTDLASWDATVDFIRVIGKAEPADASAVVQAIAKFRQKTNALVVTNAVEIAGVSTTDMEVSLEQIQSFNVMNELLEFLNEDQRAVVTKLLAETNNV